MSLAHSLKGLALFLRAMGGSLNDCRQEGDAVLCVLERSLWLRRD